MVRPLAVACFAFTSLCNVAGSAGDFRVETTVTVDKTEYKFLTLFRGSSVYDFNLTSGEVTIFDTARNAVILADKNRQVVTLADTDRQVKTLVEFDEVREFSQTLLQRAIARGEKGFFDPDIDFRYDEKVDLPYMVATNVLAYAAKGIKPPKDNRDAVRQYRQFSDMAAMLAVMKPGGIPPFVRLRLNQHLAEDGVVPTRVKRTIVRTNIIRGDNRIIIFARHSFNWTISGTDAERIDEVNSLLPKCKAVSFDRYLDVKPRVAKAPGKSKPARR